MTDAAVAGAQLDPAQRHGARLSAAEAAARLTWIVLPGTEVDRDTAELVARGAGGAVLFGHNVESPDQVRRLTADLRRAARGPFRISVDQEGGHVVRLGAPLTRFPSSMAIGATRSPALAYRVAYASATELRSVGIDVALAPVLDVIADARNPTIGSRSYGGHAGLVAALGAAAVRGYLDAGVVPTPKHFPGHGRTPLDSHVDHPVVRGGLGQLAALDLLPFQAAIAASAPVVMVGHVAYEGLTNGHPATLSPGVMRRLLRDRLGFGGVILTDAMVMDAVADGRSIPDACVGALEAGADVVMPLEPQRRVIAEIERALRRGLLDERCVAASIDRLERLDDLATCRGKPLGERLPDLEARAAAHADLATVVARRSLTLVHGMWRAPIDQSESVLIVEFAPASRSPIEDGAAAPGSFSSVLGARLPRSVRVVVAAGPDRHEAEAQAIALARSVERVVIASRDASLDRPAQMLAVAIAACGRPITHVALRSPRDVAVLPSDVAIASYSDVPASLEAVADALTCVGPGTGTRFPGRLPMALEPPVRDRRAF